MTVTTLSLADSGTVSTEPMTQTLSEFVRRSGLRSLVVGSSKDPNAKITILLVSAETGMPVLAVKAPTTDVAAEAVEREWRTLERIDELVPRALRATIPEVVDVVDYKGRPALAMTAMRGSPMTTSYLRWRHTANRAAVEADLAAVGDWLATLQQETARASAPIDMDAEVTSRLHSRFAEDALLDADLNRLAETQARLAQTTTPRTIVHGDMWFGNVLLEGKRVSGVIDWEAAAPAGEPVRDLVRFALMYALYLDRRTRPGRRVAGHAGLRADSWGAGIEFALYGNGWFPELFRRFLEQGLTRLGASPKIWRDAVIAGIAEVAAHTDDDGFARRHLDLYRRITTESRQTEAC